MNVPPAPPGPGRLDTGHAQRTSLCLSQEGGIHRIHEAGDDFACHLEADMTDHKCDGKAGNGVSQREPKGNRHESDCGTE